MKKLSKTETKKQIDFFFNNIKNKNPKDIKKIKKLAASQNVPLKNHRKSFCNVFFSSVNTNFYNIIHWIGLRYFKHMDHKCFDIKMVCCGKR